MSKHAKTPYGRFHPLSAPDFLPLPQLRTLQLQRLTAIVQRSYDRVALFRKRMDERGLTPQDLRTLEDIAQLPFAEKTDLRDTYPFGLFASPMKEIVRLHASSGTTGKPIVVAYTQEDIQVWTNVMLRAFAACGLHEGDHAVLVEAHGEIAFVSAYAELVGDGQALVGQTVTHGARRRGGLVFHFDSGSECVTFQIGRAHV